MGTRKRFIFSAAAVLILFHSAFSQPASQRLASRTFTDYALQFDGVDDFVEIKDTNNSLDLNDFTLEAWVIRLEENSTGVIIHKGAGGEDPNVNTNFALFYRGDKFAHVLWEHADSRNFEVVGTTALELNQWYHIAGVRSAVDNSLKLYVNGVLDAPVVYTDGKPNTQNVSTRLGLNDFGFSADEYMKGVIDEARIWKIPRSQAEIQAAMHQQLTGQESGLVAYWKLDEGEGQLVHDASSFSNNGTLGLTQATEPSDPLWLLASPRPPHSTNYALLYDGTDDLVWIPDQNNSLDLTDFTIECWVQVASGGKIQELVVKDAEGEDPSVNSNYSFDVWSDQKLRIVFENANQDNQEIFGNTVLEVGKLYHVAASFNSQSKALSLFVNGKLDAGPTVVVGTPNHQNQPLRIGTGYEGGPRTTTHGIIDEVRIWKIARGESDIHATMNKLLQGNENGLVGYWRFDEGNGQIIHDRSSFQNHGKRGFSDASETFDPAWVLSPWQPPVDPSDYALQFDGTNDLVQIDDLDNTLDLNDFTLEAWVYRMDQNTTEEIIHKGGVGENPSVNTNYALLFREDNFARAHFEYADSRNVEAIGTTPIQTNRWYHIAGVRSSADNGLKIYVNGVLDGPPLKTELPPNQQNSPVRLGANDPGWNLDENFKGLLDEVRIWKRARTQAEIQNDMNNALHGNEDGLVAYWRLNEGEGQVVHDLTPNAIPGHRGSSENSDTADPTWVLANRTPATGCNGIPLPAGEAYGNLNANRQTHMDKITYCFEGPANDRYLSFAVYDVDQRDEVSISLNGETLMYAPITANNTWSSLVGVLLSDAQIHDGQPNTLVFDNTRNPPQTWRYGARQVSVDPFYALPSPAAYGNITGGDTEHGDKVVYFFSGRAGDLNLAYQVFDIDHLDEVDIVLNDTKIKDEALTTNEAWSETRNLLLPDELVHNTGVNVLIFENTKNPPRNWRWGVRNVSVSVAATSSLALAGQTNASVNGQGVLNGRYLMDGQLAPPLREHGDPAADTLHYVIQGATTIALNGHALIELPSAQKIDYLTLYPEWHAARYFSYRVETSSDGSNWSTALDRMNVKLRGPQTERIAKTNVRYLRLSGVSFVVDPDSSLLNGLSESAYWQNYTSLLQQAKPEALAIAELVLLKQDGNVKVDEPVTEVPQHYRLEQNLPNPFNPSTIIRFDLPQAERVHLAIYNLRGELVTTLVDGNLSPGSHAFTFDASGLATGVYFYRVTTEKFAATKKMLLTK